MQSVALWTGELHQCAAVAPQVALTLCADELAAVRRAKAEQSQASGSRHSGRQQLIASFRAEKESVLQACLTSLEQQCSVAPPGSDAREQ